MFWSRLFNSLTYTTWYCLRFAEYTGRPAGPMIVLNMEYGKDFSGAGLALLLLFIHSFTRVDITEVISVERFFTQLHKLCSFRRSFLHFHFISAVHIWFISYIINTHFFHGNIWTHIWPAPNVSGFIAQLVEHRTGIAKSRIQTPLKSCIFFRLLYAIAKIAFTATIISSFSKQTSMRYYPHTVVLETGDLN